MNTFKLHKVVISLVLSIVVSTSSPGLVVMAQEATASAQVGQTSTSEATEISPTNQPSKIDPTIPAAISDNVSNNNDQPDQPIPSVDNLLNTTAQVAQSSATIAPKKEAMSMQKTDYQANEEIKVTLLNVDPAQLKVSVLNKENLPVNIGIAKETYGSQTIIHIIPPPEFKPGSYTLKVSDQNTSLLEQNFTWGVLAINTNKSIYAVGETAQIAIAVLDNVGEMVCDAELNLTITDPNNTTTELSTANGLIQVNPECHTKNYTVKPDYEGQYKVNGEGTYTLNLTAKTSKGSYAVNDSFSVQTNPLFSVERSTATRIFPPLTYPVTFTITPQEDFEGDVLETAPASFTVTPRSDVGILSPDNISTGSAVLGSQIKNTERPSLRLPFDSVFGISQGFGAATDTTLQEEYTGFGLQGHDGVDFEIPSNTPILAVDEGEVEKPSDMYGKTIIVRHTWGETYYGHLSRIDVKEGDKVKKGDVVGLSGNTGFTTGPHLHFGILPTNADNLNGYKGKVDPLPYLGLGENKNVLSVSTQDQVNTQTLKWHVSLKKGQTYKLGYQYNAPSVSPEFYLLGPLTFKQDGLITVFQESRLWQIAADAMIQIRQEINITDATVTATPNSIVQLDTSKYNGTVTYYFETVGQVASGTLTASLRRKGTTTDDATMSITATSYSRQRVAFTPPAGASEYTLFMSGGTTPSIKAARIIIVQAAATITSTETQLEIGNQETGKTNTTAAALTSPKYWLYESGAWDGTVTFSAEVSWKTSSTQTATIILQEDNGSFTWSNKATIVSAVSSTTPTRTRVTFTPTTARNYRIVASESASNGGKNYDVYNAKIIVNQTSASSVTKLQPQYLISNTLLAAGTALQNYDNYFDPSEWSNATNTYFNEGNGAAASTSSIRLQSTPNGTPADITNSIVTPANRTRGASSLTMPSSATDIDVKATTNNSDVYASRIIVNATLSVTADLRQIHSRWRNDDGSETTATWRRTEDISATGNIGATRRLRIEISNKGAATATSTTYRLEYGALSTTCSAIASWTAVPVTATTEHFQLVNSANLTDGSSTTNVSGGLTDDNTNFVAGQVKDTGNQTTGITLTTSDFTEIEYSLTPTSNATVNNSYCFRLTNAGSATNFTYTVYPQITIGDPTMDQKHYRWRNDDGNEGNKTGLTTYYLPTGNGFANSFTGPTGCANHWDCVNDDASNSGKSSTEPTSDSATTKMTVANAKEYYTLKQNGIPDNSTITQLDFYVWAIDTGNPNTNIAMGYCTTCDGANDVMTSTQSVATASYTKYTFTLSSLSLTSTDLNNMQIVISGDRTNSDISTVYMKVTYNTTGATWKQAEDTAQTGQSISANIRLRFSIANTGSVSGNRNYLLEYAPKIGAICGDDETFSAVPGTGTSGTFNMVTSYNFVDGDSTTTQLTATGSFLSGKMIQNPSNSSGTFSLTNGNYTEMEYVFQGAASSAGNTYCFRVTDNGSVLDTYSVYPELQMASTGPTTDQQMRHGTWFNSGTKQPFTF